MLLLRIVPRILPCGADAGLNIVPLRMVAVCAELQATIIMDMDMGLGDTLNTASDAA